MVKQTYTCSVCDGTYNSEEQAADCEKKHKEEKERQRRLAEENKKIVLGDSVSLRGKNAFGQPLDYPSDKKYSTVILMGNSGGGLKPYQLLLPHQIYLDDIRETFKEKHFEVISVIGVDTSKAIDIAYKDGHSARRWGKRLSDESVKDGQER